MFWLGIGIAVVVIVGLTWLGASLFNPAPQRADREDTPLIPGPDEDDHLLL